MTQHLYNSCEVGEAAEVCILLKLISEYAVIRLVASLNGLKFVIVFFGSLRFIFGPTFSCRCLGSPTRTY